MAGARITATIDDARAKRAIERMLATAQDPGPAMQEIGASLLTSTQQRFEDDESPEGEPWKALAFSTMFHKLSKAKRAKRRGGEHILVVKGLLLASLTYLASRIGVDVGSGRTQAAIQQFGGSPGMAPGPAAIPARPYLGLSSADETEIGEILIHRMSQALA